MEMIDLFVLWLSLY